LILKDGSFVLAGYSDMRHHETWCNITIRNQLVLSSDGTKAFPDWTEPLATKENNYTRNHIEEKLLQNLVISKLVSEGWHIEENARLKVSRVDIQASRENEILIVEAKRSASPYLIAHALGQLLFYKEQVSNAKLRLAIALPTSPSDSCKEILAKYAVEIIICSTSSEKTKENERAEEWKKSR
jgi:hypothetical protein